MKADEGRRKAPFILNLSIRLDLASVAVTATRYELDGPGIESRWRRDFPHSSRPTLGPPSLLYYGYQVSLTGEKRLGRVVEHHNPT
jgi:hypothetical protein